MKQQDFKLFIWIFQQFICGAVICVHVVFCAVASISDILDGKTHPMDYSSMQEYTEKEDKMDGEDMPEGSEGAMEQEVPDEVIFVIPPEELAEKAPARTSAASKSSGGSDPLPLIQSPSDDGVTWGNNLPIRVYLVVQTDTTY